MRSVGCEPTCSVCRLRRHRVVAACHCPGCMQAGRTGSAGGRHLAIRAVAFDFGPVADLQSGGRRHRRGSLAQRVRPASGDAATESSDRAGGAWSIFCYRSSGHSDRSHPEDRSSLSGGTAGGRGGLMIMNTKPVYLTAEGLEKLKAELSELITVDRPRVAARIHEAKLDGDLSENAEYEDAKQEQSFLEGRIATLELQLRNAAVIEKGNGDSVGIGSKVVIKGADGEETFTIVGSAEAAPREGRISNESPVGAALMGRKKGETVTVHAPAGPIEYTLIGVG